MPPATESGGTSSSKASLRLLMSCYPTGLVIWEGWQWGSAVNGVSEDAKGSTEVGRCADRPPLTFTARCISMEQPGGDRCATVPRLDSSSRRWLSPVPEMVHRSIWTLMPANRPGLHP